MCFFFFLEGIYLLFDILVKVLMVLNIKFSVNFGNDEIVKIVRKFLKFCNNGFCCLFLFCFLILVFVCFVLLKCFVC